MSQLCRVVRSITTQTVRAWPITLPSDKPSGLKEAIRILDGIDDIAICRLTGADVVRHALVQKIIAAYEQDDKQKEKRAAAAAKKPAARKTTVRKKA